MSNTENKEQSPDFELWMRQLQAGMEFVRRWKNKNVFSVNGFWGNKFNWLRAYILMPFFNFFAEFFNCLVRVVDPWNATPENTFQHSWKQTMIIEKMLAIENYRGNPHRIDYYKFFQWGKNHDMQESDLRVGDMNYHDKEKDRVKQDAFEEQVFKEIISRGIKERDRFRFAFPPHQY